MRISDVTIRSSDLRNVGMLTVKVRISHPLRFRLWLATMFIRVAAWLACAQADIGPDAPTVKRIDGRPNVQDADGLIRGDKP